MKSPVPNVAGREVKPSPEVKLEATDPAIHADRPPLDASASPEGRITSFREALNTRRQPLAALIESAELTFEDDRLQVQPQAGDALLPAALKRKNNVALFKQLVRETWGDDATWTIRDAPPDKPAKSKQDSQESKKEAVKQANQDPTVQAVLDIFGGNIQNVQRHGNREPSP